MIWYQDADCYRLAIKLMLTDFLTLFEAPPHILNAGRIKVWFFEMLNMYWLIRNYAPCQTIYKLQINRERVSVTGYYAIL